MRKALNLFKFELFAIKSFEPFFVIKIIPLLYLLMNCFLKDCTRIYRQRNILPATAAYVSVILDYSPLQQLMRALSFDVSERF